MKAFLLMSHKKDPKGYLLPRVVYATILEQTVESAAETLGATIIRHFDDRPGAFVLMKRDAIVKSGILRLISSYALILKKDEMILIHGDEELILEETTLITSYPLP